MNSTLDLFLLLTLFIAYILTLSSIQTLSRQIDRKMYNSLSVGGKVSLTDIRHMCLLPSGFEAAAISTKTLLLIKFNNYIVYSSFGLVIILLVLQGN
ncbi:hypothetical protein [Mucilaginibacter gotjawali]|uniref:Uncharacterized protein n=2 Tax=Mucilaginibacter gotjawali TaxID=1550579 RepID=A0A839S9M6_9SPHI|nr:hypothetical protein [Mucilaginibacter gotjawali]MBB3054062.1 hypothetical protein [Mucilaginibacter gotjawali]BAU54331.1 hypothetical protein MgSA37_02506 [Mucilaginibacter gotjawali]